MTISRPSVKFFAIVAGATLVLTIVLWFGLWMLGAAQYRLFIDHWIEVHRTEGYQVTYGDRETVGFPYHITLHYTDFTLQNPDGIRVHANDVSLSAFPWHWNNFDAKLKHGFDLAIPFSGTKILSIDTDAEVRDHIDLDANGNWLYVDLQMQNAKALWDAKPFFSAGRFTVAMQRPLQPAKDRRDVGLQFKTSMDDLAVPEDYAGPFGAQIAFIDIALRVMGPVPDPRVKDNVAAWSNGGGIVDFDAVTLHWGPLILHSKGTLDLDDDLQPEGAFSAQIGNHMAVIKTLMQAGYIPQKQSAMLDSALTLFTKKVEVEGKPGIEAPIAVQLGGFFLGPVRIFEFPEIIWGVAAPVPAPSLPAR